MELKQILQGIENIKIKGDIGINISQIEDNSRNVKENTLFVAIKGYDFDGHDFIEEAVKKGASAIMIDMSADLKNIKLPENITVIISSDTRYALALAACNFYGNPSRQFKLIGITGTKGKTTTTYMIKSILEKAGHKVGLIGTIENYVGEESLGKSDRTTPDSLRLQKMFHKMLEHKVDYVVMEVSSQSLKLNRIAGCHFEYGIFTNLYKDHISLKEHIDIEDYFNSKLKLFTMCRKGFVNADDFRYMKVISNSPKCEFKTYGVDNAADILAKDITITNMSVDFKVKIDNRNERIKVNIPGRFSVYNALAAISFATSIKISIEKIREGLESITVPGRNELVPNNQELAIMIDYAHTAESLENILRSVKTYTKGRVICVFGCGGERDKEKRPVMGEVSGRIADYSIVTTDNPRGEKPEDIIEEIEKGISKTKGKYETIVDRRDAIKKAISMMNKRDIVIIAGKGHEIEQEINGIKYPFDERIIVKEILEEMG